MSQRIEDLGNGLIRELIALQTTMLYDPVSQDVQIVWTARPCLYINGTYSGPAGDVQTISTTLGEISQRCFAAGSDPFTGKPLDGISSAGVLSIVKQAFATIVDERNAAPPPIAPGA